MWSGPSFMGPDLPRYGCHVTEKGRMSKSSKCVDIVAPGVVFDAEFVSDVGKRIRPAGNFYSVLRLC